MAKYAENTQVPIERSRAQIEATIAEAYKTKQMPNLLPDYSE